MENPTLTPVRVTFAGAMPHQIERAKGHLPRGVTARIIGKRCCIAGPLCGLPSIIEALREGGITEVCVQVEPI